MNWKVQLCLKACQIQCFKFVCLIILSTGSGPQGKFCLHQGCFLQEAWFLSSSFSCLWTECGGWFISINCWFGWYGSILARLRSCNQNIHFVQMLRDSWEAQELNCMSRCCGVSLAHDKTCVPNEGEVIAAGFSARNRVGDISLSPQVDWSTAA